MEIEKAIGILKERVRQIQVIVENPTTFYNEKQMEQGIKTMKEGIESSELAIQALEKQIPKSLIDEGRKLPEDTAYCPTCGAFLSKHHKFCFNCGQALKVGDKR